MAMSAPGGPRAPRARRETCGTCRTCGTCGTCGTCRWADVERGFCRVTAAWIRRDRPLYSCRHFEPVDDKGRGGKPCS